MVSQSQSKIPGSFCVFSDGDIIGLEILKERVEPADRIEPRVLLESALVKLLVEKSSIAVVSGVTGPEMTSLVLGDH